MNTEAKGYKGLGMEGPVATWYARNTGRNLKRFVDVARRVTERVPAGSRVLEVAPGPGYLAIELAKTGRYRVTGIDISRTFVRIAGENASRAGVEIDFRHGNASRMPFADASFDHVLCMAAFKNFADPLGALDEMQRVLAPGGTASIHDLRKDAPLEAIDEEVRSMNLSRVSAAMTRWTFRHMLLKRAYPREELLDMAARSRFGGGELHEQGIGLELRLAKRR